MKERLPANGYKLRGQWWKIKTQMEEAINTSIFDYTSNITHSWSWAKALSIAPFCK